MDFFPGPFRAARALLGKEQGDVASSCGVDPRVVMRLEKVTYAKPSEAAHRVRLYYEGEGLDFLDPTLATGAGVRWRETGRENIFHRKQLQAGRVLINLSQTKLAEELVVARSVVTKFENNSVKRPDPGYIDQVMRILVAKGVDFLSDGPAGGFGVRRKSEVRAEHDTA